jgi:hypothetical protein
MTKNIYLIPNDKPSRLVKFKDETSLLLSSLPSIKGERFNIYITSDKEIKGWCLNIGNNEVIFVEKVIDKIVYHKKDRGCVELKNCKKIILTNNKDLIKDGVQAIDDKFLEWFVRNSTCEFVELTKMLQVRHGVEWHDLPNQQEGREPDGIYQKIYRVVIPQEESKQETLEEASLREYPLNYHTGQYNHNNVWKREIFSKGAKWHAERMYSESDKIMKFLNTEKELKLSDAKTIERIKWYFETYFEKFKKTKI